MLSLDAQGHATLRYVQPGIVHGLRAMVEDGRPYVLASGLNNEYASASLALLDPRLPPATAPHDTDGPFTCLECPAGKPLKYLLLPPSPLNKADGAPYNRLDGVTIGRDIVATTYEAEGGAAVVYTISRDLRVLSAVPSDSYWTWQPAASREVDWRGRAGHPSSIEHRLWTSDGWTTEVTDVTGVGRSETVPFRKTTEP